MFYGKDVGAPVEHNRMNVFIHLHEMLPSICTFLNSLPLKISFKNWKIDKQEAIGPEDHRKLKVKCHSETGGVKIEVCNAQELQVSLRNR